MSNIAGVLRICVALAAAAALTSCAKTVDGVARKAPPPPGPNVPPLTESALDRIMLGVDDVSAILGGAPGLQIASSSEDLTDSTDLIDRPECLGAVFAAEKEVYNGSGWRAVRDQIIREPSDSKKHWVEQTVVLFASKEKVDEFFRKSKDNWRTCENSMVNTEGTGTSTYDWDVGSMIQVSDTMISIDMDQKNSNDWACQHTLEMVTNVIVESVVCGSGVGDASQQIVERIVQNASKK
jgi:hypothetical protein